MLLFIVLAFSGSTANEARAHISELYDVLLSPTDVNALSVFSTLFTSEAVTVSYARVPLIVTGMICLLARYFVAFCLAANLHETSHYSLVTMGISSTRYGSSFIVTEMKFLNSSPVWCTRFPKAFSSP